MGFHLVENPSLFEQYTLLLLLAVILAIIAWLLPAWLAEKRGDWLRKAGVPGLQAYRRELIVFWPLYLVFLGVVAYYTLRWFGVHYIKAPLTIGKYLVFFLTCVVFTTFLGALRVSSAASLNRLLPHQQKKIVDATCG